MGAAAPGPGGQSSFRPRGRPHRITWIGNAPARDFRAITAHVKKISDAVQGMFGGAPFREYEYLFDFLPRSYGGLEHRASQVSHFDNLDLGDAKKYENFLALVSHEYFHAWNVKSLRPEALGPFDYFRENYTEDLWFAEGITSYFDDKLIFDAGLISAASYAAVRLKDVNNLKDGTPGIARRSLADASFDAWVRYYRPDEDSANSDVSYYVKGAQLGWCWDAQLQKRTKKRWTLANLMRAFWGEFGVPADARLRDAKPGFSQDELFAFAAKKTGIDHGFVKNWVHGRKPLPWREAAAFFKVSFRERVSVPLAHFLGANAVDREGKTFFSQVYSGSEAERAGIAANDEIIALDDVRVATTEAAQNLISRRAGAKPLRITLSRAGHVFVAKAKPRRHPGLGVDFELR